MEPDYSFQEEAVEEIESDFREDREQNVLLTIPTGGGKTITAIKAINSLFEQGLLESALWTTHRKRLKNQARKELENPPGDVKFSDDLFEVIDIEMKKKASEKIKSRDYDLIVIDEAHHSAAPSYQEFLNQNNFVLGLTATPSRPDDRKLDFSKQSYSVTFSELEQEYGVIKVPEFIQVESGQEVEADELKIESESTEKFDNEDRNQLIAEHLMENSEKHSKVVIFVSNNTHVRNLYQHIDRLNQFNNEPYDHVGYITGEANEQGIDNEDYLDEHSDRESSILVNCKMLNEGYDDPSLDTVVMATPTDSLLRYMQCVGRVVRRPEENFRPPKVIEIEDDLPNIKYRIDNKWLFADISDFLRPTVVEKRGTSEELSQIANEVLNEYEVSDVSIDEKVSFSFLLFNPTQSLDPGAWKILKLFGENKDQNREIFNTFSNYSGELATDGGKGVNEKYIYTEVLDEPEFLKKEADRSDFAAAIEKAYSERNEGGVERLRYYIFRKDWKKQDIEQFLEDCFNGDEIYQQYVNDDMQNISILLKLHHLFDRKQAVACSSEDFEMMKKLRTKINNEFEGEINNMFLEYMSVMQMIARFHHSFETQELVGLISDASQKDSLTYREVEK